MSFTQTKSFGSEHIETGWDQGLSTGVLALVPGQTSPGATDYKEQ